jgi:hypothetical protein
MPGTGILESAHLLQSRKAHRAWPIHAAATAPHPGGSLEARLASAALALVVARAGCRSGAAHCRGAGDTGRVQRDAEDLWTGCRGANSGRGSPNRCGGGSHDQYVADHNGRGGNTGHGGDGCRNDRVERRWCSREPNRCCDGNSGHRSHSLDQRGDRLGECCDSLGQCNDGVCDRDQRNQWQRTFCGLPRPAWRYRPLHRAYLWRLDREHCPGQRPLEPGLPACWPGPHDSGAARLVVSRTAG